MGALENLTSNFSLSTLDQFFRNKIPSFRPDEVEFSFLFEDNEKIQDSFTNIQKLGEADLPNGDDLKGVNLRPATIKSSGSPTQR